MLRHAACCCRVSRDDLWNLAEKSKVGIVSCLMRSGKLGCVSPAQGGTWFRSLGSLHDPGENIWPYSNWGTFRGYMTNGNPDFVFVQRAEYDTAHQGQQSCTGRSIVTSRHSDCCARALTFLTPSGFPWILLQPLCRLSLPAAHSPPNARDPLNHIHYHSRESFGT